MNPPALPTCPACKQTDQVQKVTSTYSVNTKEWKETHSSTDAWGHSSTHEETRQAHTVLGLKLKPPDKPAGPTHPGLWYGIGGFIVFVILTALCPIAAIPLGFIIPLLAGSTVLPDVKGVPAWAVTAAAIGIPSLCLVVLVVVLAIWLGAKVKRRWASDMQKYKAKKSDFEGYDLPRWQRAMERWEQLYYCMRDETVFIPGENKAIKADDMAKYLYDPYFRS